LRGLLAAGIKVFVGTDRSMSECQRLRRDVELALSGPDPLRVLPLLHRLAARAESGSDECVFAHRQLAEVLLERDPWRAALHARRVTRMRPEDDRAWAALGLSQSLLGNHQYASHALTRALDCAPENPWYAHNLGHTLDVALDKPREALEYLHGRATVCGVVQLFASREPIPEPEAPRAQPTRGYRRSVQTALRRGLARLPLDEAQRAAAANIAREATQRRPPADERAALGIAAAAAWAVISRDGIPLSQAEVAACFRTSASSLRQRLGAVRPRTNVKRS